MRAVSVGDMVQMQADYMSPVEGRMVHGRWGAPNEVHFTFECLSIEDNYSMWSIRYTLGRGPLTSQIGQTSVSFDHKNYTTLGLLRLALDALDQGVFTDAQDDSGGMARGQHEAHDSLPPAPQHPEPDH